MFDAYYLILFDLKILFLLALLIMLIFYISD